ncbi:universal stress protein [Desulfobacter vibrioformis]|uniref:universal stress protein n=1 Tax=Desulfobacter vibrioformis TaxID=34031 RepID=UPI00054EEE6B|nr:universal stress protein [Desulfobacter vibrioformis]
MNKILLAFDESENAKKTVEYVSGHFNKDHEITLFYVVPNTAAACELNSPSLTPYFEKERNAFCRMEEKRQDMMRETLEAARNDLLGAGFNPEKISIKTQPQEKNIAADIAQEAQKGRYSMVAMGRRASSGIKEFFMGSNASRVMHALNGIPMVIVD